MIGAVDLGEVLTVIGIVAMANVINLIDGVDGLAAGVCAISAITLAAIALSLERNSAGVLAAVTAGGALGFLRHGFPPASSFMGDTGSNLLGYLLATIAVQGALKTNAIVALAFPLVVLAVPILDTSFVIAKRIKYRQPIFAADKSHFHHRMANIGFSQRRTIAYLYGWTAALAALALALRFVPYSDNRGHFNLAWTAVMVGFFVIAVAASLRLLTALEILKLRRFRFRQVDAALPGEPNQDVVDEGVARELETGTFEAVDPATGTLERVDPETGGFEAIEPGGVTQLGAAPSGCVRHGAAVATAMDRAGRRGSVSPPAFLLRALRLEARDAIVVDLDCGQMRIRTPTSASSARTATTTSRSIRPSSRARRASLG